VEEVKVVEGGWQCITGSHAAKSDKEGNSMYCSTQQKSIN